MANFIGKWSQDIACLFGRNGVFLGSEWESNEPKCHWTSLDSHYSHWNIVWTNYAAHDVSCGTLLTYQTLTIIPTQTERYMWFDPSNLRNRLVAVVVAVVLVVIVVVLEFSPEAIVANSKNIFVSITRRHTNVFGMNLIPTPRCIYDLLCFGPYVSCQHKLMCKSTQTSQKAGRAAALFLKVGKWLWHFPQPRFQAVGLARWNVKLERQRVVSL